MNGMKKDLSQFDGLEVLKSVHEDKNQTLRVSNGLSSIPADYSRVALTYNLQGSITNAKFYKGISQELRTITTVPDMFGSLSGTYFTLYSEANESKYYVWYNVNGSSTDPAPAGFVGIEVPVMMGDQADIVAYATELALDEFEDFIVNRNGYKLVIANTRLGTCTDTSNFGTGFSITTSQGEEGLIKSIDIPYDGKVKYIYNEQERRFEVVPVSTATVDVAISAADGDNIAISAHSTAVRLTDETNYAAGLLSTSAYTEVWSYIAGVDTNVIVLKVKADTFGSFRILVDGVVQDYYQTSPLVRNAKFQFPEELPVSAGQEITVEFIPDRIQGIATYNFFYRLEGYTT